MPRHYESTEAQCPFYRMEERAEIWCEGPGEAVLRLSYPQGSSAARQRAVFCCRDWWLCPVARMLWAQYEGTEHLRAFGHYRSRIRGEATGGEAPRDSRDTGTG